MEIPNSNELARILIIDSEGEAGEETSSYLLGAGYEVEIAMDGVQGLTLIESFQPACVLCDLGLDTIDGISVLKKIADKHSDLPKVTEALVGLGWSEEHIKGYLGGNFRRVLDKIWSAGSSV